MPKIFISYRRDDSEGEAGRLFDRLKNHYGRDFVFIDSQTLAPGESFSSVIENAVSTSDLVIVVIGPQWELVEDEDGRRRIDDPQDLHRNEIQLALNQEIPIIPVRVRGARIPPESTLPQALRGLTRRHAIELSSSRWDYDTESLLNAIDKLVGTADVPRRSLLVQLYSSLGKLPKLIIAILALASSLVVVILLTIPDQRNDADSSSLDRSEKLRVVSWNIEWMNHWFIGYGQAAFRAENPRSGINDTDALCQRVAQVVNALDPDVLTVYEGPSDTREMELFVREYLSDANGNTSFDVFGGLGRGSQRIYALVRKDSAFANPEIATDGLTKSLTESWEADTDSDLRLEDYEFTRPPLVIEGGTVSTGRIKVITFHSKSGYVSNGETLWANPTTRDSFVQAAMKNRRRMEFEAKRLREYVDALLERDKESLFIVAGHVAFGAGGDYFGRRYAVGNFVDILRGTLNRPYTELDHLLVGRVPEDLLFTATVNDFVDEIPARPVLHDHLLVSPSLSPDVIDAGIAHKEYEAQTDYAASRRQRFVSDHRPVYITLRVPPN
jgi:hypothetical protein